MNYDKRLDYKPVKILALELYFVFEYATSISAVAYKLGLSKRQLNRIVDEWHDNDGHLIVESKINLHIKK